MLVLHKKTGKLEEVSEGYARNFLIPRGLAVQATDAVVAEHEAALKQQADSAQALHDKVETAIRALVKTPVTIARQANDEGGLFGKVTDKDIIEALDLSAHGISEKDVSIQFSAVKHTGEYKAKICAATDSAVQAHLQIVITSV